MTGPEYGPDTVGWDNIVKWRRRNVDLLRIAELAVAEVVSHSERYGFTREQKRQVLLRVRKLRKQAERTAGVGGRDGLKQDKAELAELDGVIFDFGDEE